MLIKTSDITVDGDQVQAIFSLTSGREELAVVAHMDGETAVAIGKALIAHGSRIERQAPKRDRLRLVPSPAHDHDDGGPPMPEGSYPTFRGAAVTDKAERVELERQRDELAPFIGHSI